MSLDLIVGTFINRASTFQAASCFRLVTSDVLHVSWFSMRQTVTGRQTHAFLQSPYGRCGARMRETRVIRLLSSGGCHGIPYRDIVADAYGTLVAATRRTCEMLSPLDARFLLAWRILTVSNSRVTFICHGTGSEIYFEMMSYAKCRNNLGILNSVKKISRTSNANIFLIKFGWKIEKKWDNRKKSLCDDVFSQLIFLLQTIRSYLASRLSQP